MDITPLVQEGMQLVQSYSADGFKISGQSYNSAVILTPNKTYKWVGVSNSSNLNIDDFSFLKENKEDIDVVLLGTGAKMQFLPDKLRGELQEKGITIDAMDTGAACRTFNVLAPEGRRVAAMILLSV